MDILLSILDWIIHLAYKSIYMTLPYTVKRCLNGTKYAIYEYITYSNRT